MNGRRELAFMGIPTFCKFPYIQKIREKQADIGILGAPLDQGSTGRIGARNGPRSIREGSQIYAQAISPDLGVYDSELGRYKLAKTKIADLGDAPIIPTSSKKNLASITKVVRRILLNGIFPVVLGGDHSITYPVVRAYESMPLDIVHFDSHRDFSNEFMGSKITHASPLKRISELENIGNITQIGIRGLLNHTPSDTRHARAITASEAIRLGTDWVIKQIPESKNLYVTFDIDVLDPSVAPGTSTPEPGGLTYHQMRELLTRIPEKGEVRGFDLVEVNPFYDFNGTTSQVAARLILDFLAAVREAASK